MSTPSNPDHPPAYGGPPSVGSIPESVADSKHQFTALSASAPMLNGHILDGPSERIQIIDDDKHFTCVLSFHSRDSRLAFLPSVSSNPTHPIAQIYPLKSSDGVSATPDSATTLSPSSVLNQPERVCPLVLAYSPPPGTCRILPLAYLHHPRCRYTPE